MTRLSNVLWTTVLLSWLHLGLSHTYGVGDLSWHQSYGERSILVSAYEKAGTSRNLTTEVTDAPSNLHRHPVPPILYPSFGSPYYQNAIPTVDEIPSSLQIPELGIEIPVTIVRTRLVQEDGSWRSEWETAAYSAGYHSGSGFLGQSGNLIISGHNNVEGAVFARISELGNRKNDFPVGILVLLKADSGRVYVYTFGSLAVVDLRDISTQQFSVIQRFLEDTSDPKLTLITCWPEDGNTHRVIVQAKFVGIFLPAGGELVFATN